MYKKLKAISDAGETTATVNPPAPPPSGWVTITEDNYLSCTRSTGYYCWLVQQVILLMLLHMHAAGLVYTYLAGHVGRSGDEGAFRALTRGYTHCMGIRQIRWNKCQHQKSYVLPCACINQAINESWSLPCILVAPVRWRISIYYFCNMSMCCRVCNFYYTLISFLLVKLDIKFA